MTHGEKINSLDAVLQTIIEHGFDGKCPMQQYSQQKSFKKLEKGKATWNNLILTQSSGVGTSGAALLTLVDRRSRFAFIEKLNDKTQKSVIEAFGRLERRIGSKRFREIMKSLTLDNGSEFLDWESLELSAVAKTIKRFTVYFADPFASWQRGSNENFNRMVRKFIPKGADISKYTKKEIRQIENWINNYPRRILNYLSAREVFEGELECCQA